jgi:hypothetical protein
VVFREIVDADLRRSELMTWLLKRIDQQLTRLAEKERRPLTFDQYAGLRGRLACRSRQ